MICCVPSEPRLVHVLLLMGLVLLIILRKDSTVKCTKCDFNECCSANTCFNYDCPNGYSLNSSNPASRWMFSKYTVVVKTKIQLDYTMYIVGIIIFI